MDVNKLTRVEGKVSVGLLCNDREASSRVDNFVDNSEGFNHKRLKNN